MRRSNFENFNPRRYEEDLSPFGRSVLKILINQWNADADRDRHQSRGASYSHQRRLPGPYRSNKKVLTFEDANVPAPSQNAMFPPSPPLYPSAQPPRFPLQHPTIPNAFADDPINDIDVRTHRNGDSLILNDTHHRFGNDYIQHSLFDELHLDARNPPTNLRQINTRNEASIHRTYNNSNNYSFEARAHHIIGLGNEISNFSLNVRTHETSLNVRTNRTIHEFNDVSLDKRRRVDELNDLHADDIIPATNEVFPFFNKDKSHNKVKFPRFDEVPDINTGDSPAFEGIHIDIDIQRKESTPPIPFIPTAEEIFEIDSNIQQKGTTIQPAPFVPTADELFTTVEKTSEYHATETNRQDICREDLLNTPLVGSVDGNDKVGAIIGWDDMFDTELISDTELTVSKDMHPKIDACLSKDIPDPPKKNLIDQKKKPKLPEKNNSPKPPKHKIQTKVTDAVPKKVKRAEVVPKVSMNPFRKEKYTTVVKKWLHGVDPAHASKEEVTFTTADKILVEKCKGKQKVSPTVEKGKEKKVSPTGRKIIQAHLANKDGIMKFGKPSPKNSNNTTATDTNDNDESITTTTKKKGKAKAKSSTEHSEVENKTGDTATKEVKKENAKKPQETSKTKEEKLSNTSSSTKETPNQSSTKKSKRKFVVPLKSQPSQSLQTPCDGELHDVRAIKAEDEDICTLVPQRSLVVMMLMYSNGFCQANAHHATREGHADAVMVMLASEVEDRFYYVEGTEGAQAELLKHILESCSIVCYDGKDLLKYLMVHLQLDVEHMQLDVQDMKVAGSLLSPEAPVESLAALQRLLQQPVVPCGGDARNKAASYAVRLRAAARLVVDQLKDKSMWKLFTDIEMKVLPIIAAMEQRGLRVDTATLASLDKSLDQAVQSAEHACHNAAGRVFQVQSPAAIRQLIYEELKLDQLCKIKVKHTPAANDKSTSEIMLKQLSSVHPLPRRILRYRQLHKVRATFVAGITRHTHKDTLKPTWLQCAAATGRIACANPNLQALPKHPVYLDEDDDKCVIAGGDNPCDDLTDDDDDFADLADTDAVDFLRSTMSSEAISSGRRALSVRSVVSSGSPDTVLLAADYQHLECRLLAHAAQDQRLLAALAAPDLFKELAMHWLKKPVESVTSEERERCKRVVYAAAYGCGAARLAELLGAPHTASSAQAVLNSFNKAFPSISNFARSVLSRCSAEGGVIRLQSGRQRSLPDINSAHSGRRARATRQAVNFMIQGAAADLCKLSMVRSIAALSARGVHALLLLTVHDELVWTLPRHQLPAAREVVQQAMEGCGRELGGATLRLPVALRSGPHWGNMTPL